MTSLLPSSLDGARPQSTQGLHSSPAASPHIPRPGSQASLHLAPATNGGYSPSLDHHHSTSPLPFTAYPQAKSYAPSNLSLPPPLSHTYGGFPTAPPMQFFPNQYFDSRGSQPMMRTISHAHPMHSATDQTVSSRYSSSPPAAFDAPATAGYPSFNFTTETERHVNPNIFNAYPMSRSTSGASDNLDANTRLLTPHYESAHDAELRKVSDSLGRFTSNRMYPQTLSPNLDLMGPQLHGMSFAPHPQPQPDANMYVNAARGWGSDYAMSAERGKNAMPFAAPQAETDYEREREQQIMNNKKLLEDVGLGGDGQYMRARNVTGGTVRSRKASTPIRKRLPSQLDGPVRSSPRIASQYRNMSYADLDGNPVEEEDEYDSEGDQDDYEEDDFRPSKKSRGGHKASGRRVTSSRLRSELSLYSLLEVYPQIPHLFPLFYYTLLNDLSINSDSVPLIGSIPSTVNAMEKAEMLRGFFHRGRRVLAQLDAFTARCDKKYDGPDDKWPEIDFNVRIAIRDVRRKVVERCENYKYTRRDVLDKNVGKGKWQPIENGMIEWRIGMAENDPAGDLVNVTLTLPTPPPGAYPPRQNFPPREIKAIPTRRISGIPNSARSVSITMAEPSYSATTGMMSFPYTAGTQGPPPMYTETQQTPMSMGTMPMTALSAAANSSPLSSANGGAIEGLASGWVENKGVKRSRGDDERADWA